MHGHHASFRRESNEQPFFRRSRRSIEGMIAAVSFEFVIHPFIREKDLIFHYHDTGKFTINVVFLTIYVYR